MDRGSGRYELLNQASGTLMLDDPGASTTSTQLDINSSNGTGAQSYILYDAVTSTGPSGYVYCGAELATCGFAGTATVAFGANGSFDTGTFTNSVSCSNSTFSPDPAPGVAKACYYQLNNASQFSGPSGYTYCARENQLCLFAGAAVVAFGANGVFTYHTTVSGTPCNIAVYGDPKPGVAKACYYQPIK